MPYTLENLKIKTNAELCEILTSLGGIAPANGRFRPKEFGIRRILELQADAPAPIEETPKLAGRIPMAERPRLSDYSGLHLTKTQRRTIRKQIRRARRAGIRATA